MCKQGERRVISLAYTESSPDLARAGEKVRGCWVYTFEFVVEGKRNKKATETQTKAKKKVQQQQKEKQT
jgi:hypothetical protein